MCLAGALESGGKGEWQRGGERCRNFFGAARRVRRVKADAQGAFHTHKARGGGVAAERGSMGVRPFLAFFLIAPPPCACTVLGEYLQSFGRVRGLVIGARGEASSDLHALVEKVCMKKAEEHVSVRQPRWL